MDKPLNTWLHLWLRNLPTEFIMYGHYRHSEQSYVGKLWYRDKLLDEPADVSLHWRNDVDTILPVESRQLLEELKALL